MTPDHPPPIPSDREPVAHDQPLLHRYAEFRFQTVVSSITDYAVFMLDTHGNVATWNAGAERIKGYREDEIVGRHFSRFYPPDAIAAGRPAQALETAVASGHFQDESWRIRKDGSRFWASVTITAVRDESNTLRGFIKITRDMTERKRVEELETATRRLDVFIATLAHELRNQLAPLQHTIDILHSLPAAGLDPALTQCKDIAERQIGQLVRLVDDLLDIGRIKTDKVDLQQAPLNVRDIVYRSVQSIQPKVDARGQRIVVRLPPAPVIVRGDDVRLVQVLYNLLDNASKYSPNGEHIEVHVRTEASVVAIDVVDRGIGIVPGAQESIFELFEQDSSAGRLAAGGLGLGLAICRKFVGLHGGSITADSAGIGKGSSFTVRLPLAQPAERVEPARVAPAPLTTRPLRILVVDDNREAADTLAVLLEIKGHTARVAYHARDAVPLARDFAPQLMLIDLSMPDVNGFELLRELNATRIAPDAFRVALSGHVRSSDRKETADAGFNDHFAKPIPIEALDALLARVDAAAQRHGQG
ncbi:ATP-binding protein [Burkholderia vietnamiensis]|jgi:PAS domain S-box-containing protein|uniref:PAS domain-containing hybrid sensor histidine kinase/response regulator n=1 Tax=Burkholderia vietnamiensis TaxID=60552 RepID=UPI000759AEC8|nr:ATP-binding protein [Burkholderia vietnamiensis]KVF38409.1 hybrid sensor histidine kinase/response regulator [Burkholderia vietnamiensis]MBR8279270.1 PAS domain S-box protein [Burkholderia vietnamiensis]MCA8193299.1 PAS domain S-box protein [Burkholderia vietnamiensis]MDN8110471.1 ATP-binding protein [Burkholderia vietnamiensis]QTK87111.1 PAS domain S-box protein [Burkholderia vietnamiensis]